MPNNKYKGKRINGEGWVYGYLIGDDVIVGDIVDFNDEYFNTEYWYRVHSETVGRYVTTRNNQDIYVGDLLNCSLPEYENGNIVDYSVYDGEIVWDEKRYKYVLRTGLGNEYIENLIQPIVVGNKWDWEVIDNV